MKRNKTAKAAVAVLLCAFMFAGCTTPPWVNTAISDIPVVIKIVTTILPLVAAVAQTPAGTIDQVTNVTSQITADLTTVENLFAQYKASPNATVLQKIDATILDVQSNMGTILVDAHVSNPATQAAITEVVNLAQQTLLAIQSNIPAPAARFSQKLPAQKVPSPAQIKSSFNAIMAANGLPDKHIE